MSQNITLANKQVIKVKMNPYNNRIDRVQKVVIKNQVKNTPV